MASINPPSSSLPNVNLIDIRDELTFQDFFSSIFSHPIFTSNNLDGSGIHDYCIKLFADNEENRKLTYLIYLLAKSLTEIEGKLAFEDLISSPDFSTALKVHALVTVYGKLVSIEDHQHDWVLEKTIKFIEKIKEDDNQEIKYTEAYKILCNALIESHKFDIALNLAQNLDDKNRKYIEDRTKGELNL